DGERCAERPRRSLGRAFRPFARLNLGSKGRRVSLATSPRLDAAQRALARGAEHLRRLQHPDGWWKGELETNVTIDAEDLFVRHYLGILTSEQKEATARWIRSKQREDGSWATFFGGPADVSTTVEAYVALRLACDPLDAAH